MFQLPAVYIITCIQALVTKQSEEFRGDSITSKNVSFKKLPQIYWHKSANLQTPPTHTAIMPRLVTFSQ
jgi:hypothetical protein